MKAPLILLAVLAAMGLSPAMAQTERPQLNSQDSALRTDVVTLGEAMPSTSYSLQKYMATNLRYPAKAKAAKKEGKVLVGFVVEADGQISQAQVEKGMGFGADEEALRVVQAMPRWRPGQRDGRPAAIRMKLPVYFRLAPPAKK